MQRIVASVTLLFSLSSLAQIESLIQFKGQNAETINLSKQVTVVRPEAYEANTTCTRQIPREVCVERLTREVCHTNSRGEQSCHDEQGERTCRDIPYSEEVCGNVTRYDEESYACTETRYRDVSEEKKLSGIMNVVFLTNGLVNEFPMTVGIMPASQAMNSFNTTAKLGKEPTVLVVVKQKNVKIVGENAKEINVEAKIMIEIIDPKIVAPSFPAGFNDITMDEKLGLLKIEINGSLSAAGAIEAVLSHKPFLASRKTVAELKAQYPSDRAKIESTSLVLNLNNLVSRDLKKKMQLDLKLSAPLSIPGEVLNAKKPKTEQMYEGLKVRLN